jgi:hypothetical protein
VGGRPDRRRAGAGGESKLSGASIEETPTTEFSPGAYLVNVN